MGGQGERVREASVSAAAACTLADKYSVLERDSRGVCAHACLTAWQPGVPPIHVIDFRFNVQDVHASGCTCVAALC